MASLPSFIHSQLFVSLPEPTGSLSGKTVIVTGSNVGLGKEAARYFARLNAATVILAVRSPEKGNAAKEDIEASTGRKGVVQVWQLDMASYESVQQFAARAEKELNRLDVAVLNAGVARGVYERAEDNESTITVNVVSTFLLALSLLPKLKETASKFNVCPNLSIVSSEVHFWSPFKEQSAPEGGIFDRLNDKATADMADRYQVSKLLEVFGVRAIAERRPGASYPVTINYLNPGLCHSELSREAGWGLWLMKLLLARSTEYGSRTLVHAATAGSETHGEYLSDCKVTTPAPIVQGEKGHALQERVWKELERKLEAIKPGVTKNL